jgi:ornithine--oxo-acid transaminase
VPKIGPFAPDTGKLIEYGDLDILRETFGQSADRIAAFMIEPIQGVAG